MKKIMFNDRFGLTDAVLTGRKTMTRRLMPENIAKMVEAASKPTLLILHLPDDFDEEKFAEEFSKFQGVVTYKEGSEVQQVQQCDPEQIKKNIIAHAHYKVGEVVAVAQNYDAVLTEWLSTTDNHMSEKFSKFKNYQEQGKYGIWDKAGLNNKMFVRADVMPHQIKIKDIRFERLRDISDEDCRKEGIIHVEWKQWLEQDINDFSPQQYKTHDVWTLPIFEEGLCDPCGEQSKDDISATNPKTAFTVLFAKLAKMQPSDIAKLNPWVFVYEFELVS